MRAEGKERGRKLEGKKKTKDEFLFHPFLEKVEFSPMITRRGLVWNAWVRPRVQLVCPVYLGPSSSYVDSISGTFLPVSLKAYHRGQPSFCKASGKPRVKWKKQKGSQESNCWECANSRARVAESRTSQGHRAGVDQVGTGRQHREGRSWRQFPEDWLMGTFGGLIILLRKKERENPRPEFAVFTDKI